MTPDLHTAFVDALNLRYLLGLEAWVKKPATLNKRLTPDQIAHRGYMLNVIVTFEEMQISDPLIVDN